MSTTRQIDFGLLYRHRMEHSGVQPKRAGDWDSKRARELATHGGNNLYAQEFIARMDLRDCATLLDVGCGPGTLALPLAARLQQVHALDYSQHMLDVMAELAAEQRLDNIQGIHRSWEDDWSDIPVCDISIASRSSTVRDLQGALEKITSKARRRVYLTHIVGQFIEIPVLEAIGRAGAELPDYIYVINILYGMGLHPRVDYIEAVNRLAGVKDFDELVKKVSWSLGALDEVELERLLRHYLQTRERGTLGKAPARWAFISWEPQ